ncbi:hypothetical protein D9619_002173 [Psilocybe cf. subviscida]|uniref:Uncharacterized protein n=1 Tax=Psilocybe cf. subviscida TaxID=2480587 RepID=A0A8H5BD57_9AGAR|nr:hypothetical protein D9619_002173 [Psilocybe cf. subviscida]
MGYRDGGVKARHLSCLFLGVVLVLANVIRGVEGHVAAFHKAMYCFNGTKAGVENLNAADAITPLYKLNKTDWWMHHMNRCDEFPPAPGDFLELPANGEFTVEHATSRAFTTLSYNGKKVGLYVDGQDHPDFGGPTDGKVTPTSCISNPNIHTQNETMAAGTIFAISYNSELSQVTEENLVVFTVLPNTPWRRIATYKVPNLPACPPGGCICTWGWVANGCGEPNMYMQPFRCKVVGDTGNAAVRPGVPPVWCEDDPSKCIVGPKQMIFFNQLEGNNVQVDGFDLSGDNRHPTYNNKMGFSSGAQTDIFQEAGTATPTHIPPSSNRLNAAEYAAPAALLPYAMLISSAILWS